jgi:Recombination endonuclease VII
MNIGDKYGKRSVLALGYRQHKTGWNAIAICICDCGRIQEVKRAALKSGAANSCRSCSSKNHKSRLESLQVGRQRRIMRCTNAGQYCECSTPRLLNSLMCNACKSRFRNYGILPVQWFQMLSAQDYKCDMCGESLGDDSNLDHHHAKGYNRGIVHSRCNSIIGWIEHPLYQKALEYIKRHVENQEQKATE